MKGPFYDTAPHALRSDHDLSIQFHVPTSATSSAPYSFCISNLSAILSK